MNNEDELEEFLAHFGVKGMKWGKRKDASSYSDSKLDREIKRADRKVKKTLDSKYLFDGMVSRDFAYKDFERRMKKKDPAWKTSKLPPGEMKRLMDKALVREQKKTMITGALVTAAFVGGAFGLAKASGLNARNTRIGVGLVGATAGKQVVDLLISQSTAKKFIRESDKQDALEAERERRGR